MAAQRAAARNAHANSNNNDDINVVVTHQNAPSQPNPNQQVYGQPVPVGAPGYAAVPTQDPNAPYQPPIYAAPVYNNGQPGYANVAPGYG